jgi:nicotinamide-nucleotide amidase
VAIRVRFWIPADCKTEQRTRYPRIFDRTLVRQGHREGTMFTPELIDLAQQIGGLLRERKETVSVAEGSAGGLISASLLAIPGASAYYLGGSVIYTARAKRAFLGNAVPEPEGMRGATEEFARFLAEASLVQLRTTWAIGEAGAAGPANPYGDPAGHVWLAIAGPRETTKHVLTGSNDRSENMLAFTTSALDLFLKVLSA